MDKRSASSSEARSDTADTTNKERIAEEGRMGTPTVEAM